MVGHLCDVHRNGDNVRGGRQDAGVREEQCRSARAAQFTTLTRGQLILRQAVDVECGSPANALIQRDFHAEGSLPGTLTTDLTLEPHDLTLELVMHLDVVNQLVVVDPGKEIAREILVNAAKT